MFLREVYVLKESELKLRQAVLTGCVSNHSLDPVQNVARVANIGTELRVNAAQTHHLVQRLCWAMYFGVSCQRCNPTPPPLPPPPPTFPSDTRLKCSSCHCLPSCSLHDNFVWFLPCAICCDFPPWKLATTFICLHVCLITTHCPCYMFVPGHAVPCCDADWCLDLQQILK